MTTPKSHRFRTRFRHENQAKPKVTCTIEEGKTKPEFEAECDINLIMARYKKTGQLPMSLRQTSEAFFGDFSQVPDLMQTRNLLDTADDLFAALPAKVRREFNNDPAEFLAAAQTPEGQKILHELGLGKTLPDEQKPTQERREATSPSSAGQADKTPSKGKRAANERPEPSESLD